MGNQQGGVMGLLFPIVLFVLIFFFLIYRPQKKKQQQHDKMIASIGRGDTIITAGGFFGVVSEVLDDSYIIELADGVKVRILKTSISIRREQGDAQPRVPRKKKRRRRPEDGGPETTQEQGEEMPESEGVTAEENEALTVAVSVDESGEKDEVVDTTAVEESKENKQQ